MLKEAALAFTVWGWFGSRAVGANCAPTAVFVQLVGCGQQDVRSRVAQQWDTATLRWKGQLWGWVTPQWDATGIFRVGESSSTISVGCTYIWVQICT